ncbi:MAG: RNA polymerase sigma factor [Candidatus Glassbacteria bacterium]|nr:RNA polymerase sigma factor [Candidatus Glassbacteria bacterium]
MTSKSTGMTERELIDHGFRYALSLTHHEQDAEDLVQTAFFRLYRSRGRVEHKALLITTIRNLFFDQCRRKRNKLVITLDNPEELIQLPSPTQSLPGTNLDMDELLARLRPEEREALYLSAVDGCSASEIANLTDQPRNTVLSLIHRAKKKLQAVIAREENRMKRRDYHD